MNKYDLNCGECHVPVEYGTCPYCGADNQPEEDRKSWPFYVVGAEENASIVEAEVGRSDHDEPDPDLQAG